MVAVQRRRPRPSRGFEVTSVHGPVACGPRDGELAAPRRSVGASPVLMEAPQLVGRRPRDGELVPRIAAVVAVRSAAQLVVGGGANDVEILLAAGGHEDGALGVVAAVVVRGLPPLALDLNGAAGLSPLARVPVVVLPAAAAAAVPLHVAAGV